MSEKSLTDAEWKKFAKGRGLKDAPLLKALAELDKAERAKDADARLAALALLGKEADALRKANKSDKEITAYLDELDKAAARERKQAEKDLKDQKAREQEAAENEEDEDEAPDLLTTKLIPLMRLVRKGDVMKVMIATTGKDTAVLLSRKPIGPPRRKLLSSYLGATGGVKFILGDCLWEENANTFVVQSQAAGLAKKLKAALLAQTETRYKVRVRGEDGELDDDCEPAEADGPGAPAPSAAQAQAAAPAEPAVVDDDGLMARFEARMAALAPQIAAALQAQSPEATKIRALEGFAREKAEAGNAKAALAALDQLDKILAAGTAAAATAPRPIGHVDYAKCRLAWEAARKKVQAELQKLEQTILADYRDEPGLGEIAKKVRRIDAVLGDFSDDLSGMLDRALNAAEPAERERLHREAGAVIRRYLDRAANDPFIAQIERNPFVPITAQATLVATLGTLAKLIA